MDLSLAVVCHSNLNRSMAAHLVLQEFFAQNRTKTGRVVLKSYGAGTRVKLPGETQHTPNVYTFGTPYEGIFNDLKEKNFARYTKNGMLNMLDRNRKLKTAPERWQDEKTKFDLVITYDKRVFDTVIEDIQNRRSRSSRGVHIINLETTDTHEKADRGAQLTLDLMKMMVDSSDWENELSTIMETFEEKHNETLLHTILFY